MSSSGRLTGKLAIVTGGGSGIGRAICHEFAREGASVAVMDINRKGIEETLSTLPASKDIKHLAIEADVTSVDQVQKAFKIVEQEMGGKSTVLVNNAGILRVGYFDDISDEDFDAVINTNLKGVFLMSKAFLSQNVGENTDKERVIVNISSINAKCGQGLYAPYNASKSGVLGLTKTIALEYPKHKVRCNAVLPGFIYTPMTINLEQKKVEDFIESLPMKRAGQPEEVAKACLFLASDESSYVNGACLEVAGGFGL